MDRRFKGVLFASVVALACAEWLVSPTIAQRDENEATQAPTQVPQGAFLTGAVRATAVVDGLEVSLLGEPGEGFALAFHNPTSSERAARLDVDCVQVSGSPLSRMRVMPTVVHSERVAVRVAPGATVRRALEADVAPPTLDTESPTPFANFNTTSFHLRAAGAGADVEPLAELRWSNPPAAAPTVVDTSAANDVEAG